MCNAFTHMTVNFILKNRSSDYQRGNNEQSSLRSYLKIYFKIILCFALSVRLFIITFETKEKPPSSLSLAALDMDKICSYGCHDNIKHIYYRFTTCYIHKNQNTQIDRYLHAIQAM